MKYRVLVLGVVSIAVGGLGCAEVQGGSSGGTGGNPNSGGTGGGGALICDDGTSAPQESAECDDCLGCAIEGPCQLTNEACNNSAACQTLIACLNACPPSNGVDPCADECIDGNVAGAELLADALQCESCNCPNNCALADLCIDTSGLVCDNGSRRGVASVACDNCFTCATDGPCETQYEACGNSQACVAIEDCAANCVSGPDVGTCIDGCVAQHPDGVALWDAQITCIYCQECPNNCVFANPLACP